MAKKNKPQEESQKKEKKRSRWRFADFFAFLALSVSAILLVFGPVLRLILDHTGKENIYQIINTVVQYCMLAAIAIPAWYFVRGKRSSWIVFYFLVLIIYIVGTVLGYI